MAVFTQLVGHARAAVSLSAFDVNGFDLLAQGLVLLGASAGSLAPLLPVVVAAGRDFQDLAKQ